MASLNATRNTIFESTDKAAMQAIYAEVLRHKGSSARLDQVVEAGVAAGINVIRASVSLNRLNALAVALRKGGENSRLAKIQRVPEYINRTQCIAYSKEQVIFYFTNYTLAKSSAGAIKTPAESYLEWIKKNRKQAAPDPLTEKQATAKIRKLYVDMLASRYCTASPQLAGLIEAIQDYLTAYDGEFMALQELERVKEALDLVG